jgi:hypothetical protein
VDDGGKYGPIVVNGDLDKQVWRQAERTQRFAQMSGEVSLFNTEAAMLWDDDNVYIAFWLEEPDVRCTGQDRDGILWQENTVEVSIAGAGAYYNLSVNPRNKTSELFFIWKDAYTRGSRYDVAEFDLAIQRPMVFGGDAQPHDERGMRWGFLDWRFPGLHTAVQIDGTLNERTKVDRGWTVELALPWEGLQRLADGATPARSGDTWRLALARNEVIDQCGTRNTATWNWQPTGAPGGVPYVMHKPDRFPRVTFQ